MSLLRFDCRFRYPAGFQLDLAFETGGGVTALVGPSGSGKSTTLQLIAGLLKPHDGRIELGQRVLTDMASRTHVPPEKRAVGLVFQDYQLFPHLTAEDNLLFGRKRTRRTSVEVSHLIEVLEVGSLLSRYPATLSGGQRQRIALGRAILSGPELLLLDEPLSAVDEELRQSIAGFLERVIAEYRLPTLLVTHDQSSVERLAQQTIRLTRAGRREPAPANVRTS